MVVALLVVIVLILLLGAGVVKGWLVNIAGVGCGGILLLFALLWLGSFFGENGFTYIVYGIMAVIGMLAIIGLAAKFEPTSQAHKSTELTFPRTEVPADIKPAEVEQRDRVWSWFADDIALKFTPEARAIATRLYDENDVIGLDRFCRGQRNAPKY